MGSIILCHHTTKYGHLTDLQQPHRASPTTFHPHPLASLRTCPSSRLHRWSYFIHRVHYNKCRTAATTLDLVADISRCQRASAAGTTIYMRADCYENNTIHGSICGSDSTCSTCQPLPPAPSDLCVPYSVSSIVNGIKITCPPRPEPVAPASKTGAASTISAPPGYACFLVLILNLALLAFV